MKIQKYVRAIGRICSSPRKIFYYLSYTGIFNNMNDVDYIKKYWYSVFGYHIDLNCPKTFTEKLQWLKLYNRKEQYSTMVDKYLMKQYVSEMIGQQYVVPLIGVWDSVESINWEILPNQFIIKCTHDCHSYIICKDKTHFNIEQAKKKLQKCMTKNYYNICREYPYKNLVPRIIAEELLIEKEKTETKDTALTDYKFFCFNGVPKIMYISNDTGNNPHTDFFDMDFNNLDIKMADPNSSVLPDKPECFEEMKSLAKKLSNNIPFLRVDYYYVNHRIYVGELTFFHCGGFRSITPAKWNEKMGEWLELPNKDIEE